MNNIKCCGNCKHFREWYCNRRSSIRAILGYDGCLKVYRDDVCDYFKNKFHKGHRKCDNQWISKT